MLRGRVPVGHPWALGTVMGGGRRCIIDKSNWLYTQNSNNLTDLYGITWSVPKGKSVPECRELVDPCAHMLHGQVVLDMNWIDAIMGVTNNILVQDKADSTMCVTRSELLSGVAIPFVTEFVYPNTCIKRYGEGIVFYETITPIEYEKTLLTWTIKHSLDTNLDAQFVSLIETVRVSDGDPFQRRIMDRLDDMIVDNLKNTFVLL